MDQSKDVFTDVIDDFSKLSSIKEHFEGWKFNFSSSYEQAYISLCVPKVFAPFVRLQLLRWNPLDPDCSEQLEDMLWFQVLMFFGFSEGREVDPAEDEDLQLIPNLVDLVVIPKLTGRSSKPKFENSWY
jgi:GC-rich sequence DNA-binding factor